MTTAAKTKTDATGSAFSTRAFLQGLGIIAFILAAIAGWGVLQTDKAQDIIDTKLASQTVIVEWVELPTRSSPQAEKFGPPREEDIPAEVYDPPEILDSGLAGAPIDGLFETTPDGRVPVIRSQDGLTAFKAYRRPFDLHAAATPIIAIAIAGLGLSDIATESAVRTMPPEVSFIMSPYAETLDFWVRESRARGHEIWLTLPMETKNFPADDPGPHSMLVGAPERENAAKLEWLLARVDGYIGFITPFEPVFMDSANDMRPVIGKVLNSGLAFVDGSEAPGLIPQSMAVGMKAPYSTVDIWLDRPGATQEEIAASLRQLEAKAREQGFAVGIIHALPVSYQQVLEWVPTLSRKGIRLAPLSATTGH